MSVMHWCHGTILCQNHQNLVNPLFMFCFISKKEVQRDVGTRSTCPSRFCNHNEKRPFLSQEVLSLTYFILFFILKLFTQGTIQSIYCFTIGPAKTIYKIKSYIIQNLQQKMKNNVYDYFSLSLDLKALIEGAIFVSKSRLFQRLAPRYAKDFWPLPVLNMGIARSVFEFLNSLGCTPII